MNDDVIIEVFTRMVQVRNCSADEVLVTPELREEYLSATREILGAVAEGDLLHRLIHLRKRSKLPRSRGLVGE